MAHLHTIRKKGALNLPGITYATKSLTEQLLLQDAEKYHCYIRAEGQHNHLSHQVLATYDMGASEGLIQKIYDMHASCQRPIYVEKQDEDIVVNKENWAEYLGKQEAYGAYFKFFSQEVEKLGPSTALESYVFLPEANVRGRNMLDRFLSGALHPLIQIGYATEFGIDSLIATGLSQTAIHESYLAKHFPYSAAWGPDIADNAPSIPHAGLGGNSSVRISLLEVLRQVYDSEILTPSLPYNPDLLLSAHVERRKSTLEGDKPAEIRRICQRYNLSILNDASQEELDSKIEEFIWIGTLLMFATGREGQETRLDFFLMHLVTSSIFLPSIFKVLKNTRAKVALVRHLLPHLIVLMLLRGRPVIRANLVREWTTTPRPSGWRKFFTINEVEKGLSIGDIRQDEDYNPWLALIQGALHHPDMHVAKVMRTLIYASEKYGGVRPGEIPGAFRSDKTDRQETFKGISEVDGTLFVRAAGIMMGYMKWTICGESGREDWDRSALGWDDAWVKKN